MSSDENDTAPTGSDTDLGKLIAKVDDEHGEDGAAAMADQLRGKVEETEAEPEAPGDLED
ncbi:MULTISPECIES: hypothetical protein [unclassified Microbacterium]|uniref:hypothetical protein n=1 Tax=unclassified Microbacterium TaxID=2609290 RepID=UPI000D577D83|nr:hypothetical protein [Microbacterium sp. Gd 4-13]PVW03709.1 hypothetical protein DEA06_12650 [Microbacterium sp. Gd 4-13]